MKIHSSLLLSSVVLIVMAVLLVVLVPLQARAQTSNADRAVLLCGMLDSRKQEITAKLSEQKAKLKTAEDEQKNNRTTQRSAADSEIAAVRDGADKTRAEAQGRMLDKARSDEQKAAIAAYKQVVEQAVATRRAAFDAARSDFRQSVDGLQNNYQGTVDSRIGNLESTVDQAFVEAGQYCRRSRAASEGSREAFISSLKQARLDYNEYRRTRQDTTAKIKELILERDAAFKAAMQTFQQSMEQARSTLKAAL